MNTQTVVLPVFYQQRKQYEILPNNTPVTVRLKYFMITGVQGTNVGDCFALRLNSAGDWVHESFYILRDNNNSSIGPSPGNNKISGTKDVPLPINASPTTSHEWNNPMYLTYKRPISAPGYIFDPVILLGNDGVTEPIYEKAIIILELDYVPDKYGTTNLDIIKPVWRN